MDLDLEVYDIEFGDLAPMYCRRCRLLPKEAAVAPLNVVLDRLRAKAEADEHVADVLEFLAADTVADPFAIPQPAVLAGARAINRRRQDERRAAFRARSLTTAQVVGLISSMSDRKAVDRRRRRGTLLGVRVGNETLHPEWQFDRRRGETRHGIDRVLAALREVVGDDVAADALMVADRDDLGGRSIATVFAGGDLDLALRIVGLAGDQS